MAPRGAVATRSVCWEGAGEKGGGKVRPVIDEGAELEGREEGHGMEGAGPGKGFINLRHHAATSMGG